MKFTEEQIKCVIGACNNILIENVYVESNMQSDREISQIRVKYYSGSNQGIMYDVDKEYAERLISEIYRIKNNNIMEKYKEVFTTVF